MNVRQPDALDYALVAGITGLGYLQWPGRHGLHASLWDAVVTLRTLGLLGVDLLLAVAPEHYLILALTLGVVFLVLIVEVVPRLSSDDTPETPPRR